MLFFVFIGKLFGWIVLFYSYEGSRSLILCGIFKECVLHVNHNNQVYCHDQCHGDVLGAKSNKLLGSVIWERF